VSRGFLFLKTRKSSCFCPNECFIFYAEQVNIFLLTPIFTCRVFYLSQDRKIQLFCVFFVIQDICNVLLYSILFIFLIFLLTTIIDAGLVELLKSVMYLSLLFTIACCFDKFFLWRTSYFEMFFVFGNNKFLCLLLHFVNFVYFLFFSILTFS